MFGKIRLWGYNERRKWYKRAKKRYKKGIIVGEKGRKRKGKKGKKGKKEKEGKEGKEGKGRKQ